MSVHNLLDYPTPQDAANAAMANGGVLLIPAERIPISAPIQITDGITVRGEGYGARSTSACRRAVSCCRRGIALSSTRNVR